MKGSKLNFVFNLKSELIYTLISYISIFFSGIITIKVFTKIFTPSVYAYINLTTSISSLIITTFISPLMQGASRYYDSSNPRLSFDYIKKYLKYIQLGILIVCLILGTYNLINHQYEELIITILLLLTLFLDSTGQYYNSILHINRKRIEYTVSTSIFNWLKLIITIPFFLFSKSISGIIIVLICWAIASFISNFYSANRIENISNNNKVNLDPKVISKLNRFVVSFFLLNIFLWLQSWADKWILNYVFDNSNDLGIYISYSQVAMIPFLALNGLIIMYFGPIIFGEINNIQNHQNLKIVKETVYKLKVIYIVVSVVFLIFIFLLNKFFIKILINSNHEIDSVLFILTSTGAFLFNYSQIQSFSIQCTGILRNIIIPNIISGLLLVLCNLFLAKNFGIMGAVIILNIVLIFKIIITYFFEEFSWKNFILSFSNSNY